MVIRVPESKPGDTLRIAPDGRRLIRRVNGFMCQVPSLARIDANLDRLHDALHLNETVRQGYRMFPGGVTQEAVLLNDRTIRDLRTALEAQRAARADAAKLHAQFDRLEKGEAA